MRTSTDQTLIEDLRQELAELKEIRDALLLDIETHKDAIEGLLYYTQDMDDSEFNGEGWQSTRLCTANYNAKQLIKSRTSTKS